MVIEGCNLPTALERVDRLLDALCFGLPYDALRLAQKHAAECKRTIPGREDLIEALNAIRAFREQL